jgi:predicted acetyltransferase
VDAALKFMIAQGAKVGTQTLEWEDPSGDPASTLFSGSRSEPFLMGRVTDICAVLEGLEYPAGLSAEMDLTVLDSLAPWNNGSFHWRIHQGKGSLFPVPAAAAPTLPIGMGTLSRLIFGERPAREILAAGIGERCFEAEIETLEQIFPACRNFISEYF